MVGWYNLFCYRIEKGNKEEIHLSLPLPPSKTLLKSYKTCLSSKSCSTLREIIKKELELINHGKVNIPILFKIYDYKSFSKIYWMPYKRVSLFLASGSKH